MQDSGSHCFCAVPGDCRDQLRRKNAEKRRENQALRSDAFCFYAPLYATIELGYFKDEGLEVELINGGGADKVMIAVITGQADIGFAGPEACIYTCLEGQKDHPKIFGQLTKRDGSFLIGRNAEEFHWEDLRGKTILGGRKGGVPEMTLK